MNPPKLFNLNYAPQVKTHLRSIKRKHHSLIRRTIENQLQFEPNVETRNRKPLKRPAELGADWELRFGPDNCFRVFYAVELNSLQVSILAIGIKQRNRLFIGGDEVNI